MSNTDNPWKDEKKNSFLGEITHLEKDNQINSILFNYERHNGKKKTVHKSNQRKICSLGPIKNEYLKFIYIYVSGYIHYIQQ